MVEMTPNPELNSEKQQPKNEISHAELDSASQK